MEDWRKLCEQILVEKDSAKLLDLVTKLNEALDEQPSNIPTKTQTDDRKQATACD